jgi:hypothetical protein
MFKISHLLLLSLLLTNFASPASAQTGLRKVKIPIAPIDRIRILPERIIKVSSLTYLFVPDYVGSKVNIVLSDSTPPFIAASGSTYFEPIALPSCNPNSVAVNRKKLYVACNKDSGKSDKILVYDLTDALKKTSRSRVAERIVGNKDNPTPIQTITSPEFSSLIALAFDSSNNLWASNYGNGQIVRVSSAGTVDKKLVNSPSQPAGIVFGGDGSLWVAGQFSGGIVLNFAKSELEKSGFSLDPTPRYCISNSAGGCKQVANLFRGAEGIALVNNLIWVSNNGGDRPGAELVALEVGGGQLNINSKVGQGAGNPFSCPGGLFFDGRDLYVNDQSYGLTNTSCGANDAQTAVNGVLKYTGGKVSGTPVVYSKVTSRPGFGGIAIYSVVP